MRRYFSEITPLVMLTIGILAALFVLFGPALVDYIGGEMLPPATEQTDTCSPNMTNACNRIFEDVGNVLFIETADMVTGFVLNEN